MAKIIIGIFNHPVHVEKVVPELSALGIAHDNIGIVAKNGEGVCTISDTQDHDGDGSEHGMGRGVAIGGALSALAMGLSLIIIPPLGALAVGGPLLALVLATGIGAAAGGLVGALADMGVEKSEAEFYCSAVRNGGILLTIKSSDEQDARAVAILSAHGARNISIHEAKFSPEELHELSEPVVYVPEVLPEDHGFEDHLEDFRVHYLNYFSASGFAFDSFRPAYEYGWWLGSDQSGITRDWILLEPEARGDWEERNGKTWETFRDAVRHGWESVRAVPAGS